MAKSNRAILDADKLMAKASEIAGLADFGDSDFVEPLMEYLAAADRYFPFSETQAANFAGGITNELVNRLRMTRDLKRHPEILDEDVSDPIVITGMPRTGTTKLQRVLSADPANQALLYWKVINFAPFPDALPGESDPRIDFARAACDQIAAETPEVLTGHPFLHDQAEEECIILGANYDHFQNTCVVCDESYRSYIQSLPRESAYQYLRTVLQYLQWQQGGKHGPWILKSPVHLGYLNEVLATFPNATLVQGHRDAVSVLASVCHFAVDLIQPMQLARLDRHKAGKDQFQVWGGAWDKNQADREALPADTRFIDIRYEDIKDNAVSVAERIYEVAGRSLTKTGSAAIERWEVEHRKDKFGKHEYRLEDYGLTSTQIEERFRLRTPMQ